MEKWEHQEKAAEILTTIPDNTTLSQLSTGSREAVQIRVSMSMVHALLALSADDEQS